MTTRTNGSPPQVISRKKHGGTETASAYLYKLSLTIAVPNLTLLSRDAALNKSSWAGLCVYYQARVGGYLCLAQNSTSWVYPVVVYEVY